jgi:hypothetical protein
MTLLRLQIVSVHGNRYAAHERYSALPGIAQYGASRDME